MKRRWAWLLPLAAVALLAGGLLRHLASEKPDGLEAVAERHGFADREAKLLEAPLSDYELPWHKTALGKSLVGLGGAFGAFGLVYGLGLALRLRRRREGEAPLAAPESRGDTEAGPPSPRLNLEAGPPSSLSEPS